MNITTEQLKSLYHGVCNFKVDGDGYLAGYHFTDEQIESTKFNEVYYVRATRSGCISLCFTTTATEMSFDYKIIDPDGGMPDTVDIYVNNFPLRVYRMDNLGDSGNISLSLPKGEKQVEVYFVCDCEMRVKNLTLNAPAKAVEYDTKVLWIGDSITQGIGPRLSGKAYVNHANRYLKYNALVQAIGGYCHQTNILSKIPDFDPEKIIVALGTNGAHDDDLEEKIYAFYDKLLSLYPDKPILVVSPIWREEYGWDKTNARTRSFLENVKNKYNNIMLIDGEKLIPHTSDMFLDGTHPNSIGSDIYAETLVRTIYDIGF